MQKDRRRKTRGKGATVDALAPLKESIKAGKLADVQAWIDSGESLLYPPDSKRRSVIEVAADTGFYSVVEVLAGAWTDQGSLDRAMDRALSARHGEVAKLLVEKGADPEEACLHQVAGCYAKDLMQFFLDRVEDPTRDDALANAITAKARPLVGLFRERCREIPGGDAQLAKALKEFVQEPNAKWTSLALWMGADPRLRVTEIGDDDEDDPTSAIEDAFETGDMETIRCFKLDQKKDDPTSLLSHLHRANIEVVDYLLAHGARINNAENGGCSLLNGCLWRMSFNHRDCHGFSFDRGGRRELEELIKRGARLVPPESYDFRIARDAILGVGEYSRSDFLKLLASATEPAIIFRMLNTPRMRRELGVTAKRLMKKLRLPMPEATARPKEPKKSRAEAPASEAKAKDARDGGANEQRPPVPDTSPPPVGPSPIPPDEASTASTPQTPGTSAGRRLRVELADEKENNSVEHDTKIRRPRKPRRVRLDQEPTTLTRKELHEEVWSTPMVKLGEKYGLSDVGIAKICRKHGIPRPPRGYWAKKQHGKNVRQTPLPNPPGNPEIVISPYGAGPRITDDDVQKEAGVALDRADQADSRIEVPERLTKPHPLIKETKLAILENREAQHGWRGSGSHRDRLAVYASDELLPRALRIMDTLVKVLESRGYAVRVTRSTHGSTSTAAIIMEQEVRFSLREEGTGRLCLTINSWSRGLRRNWRDGKRQRVEHVLDDFIVTLVQVAAHEKDKEIRKAREREKREAERRKVQIEIDAWNEEYARVTTLRAAAREHDEAQAIRAYAEARREAWAAADGELDSDGERALWFDWALKQADRIDPVTPSPPSLLDTPCPEMPRELRRHF
jgi:hypothetical protein